MVDYLLGLPGMRQTYAQDPLAGYSGDAASQYGVPLMPTLNLSSPGVTDTFTASYGLDVTGGGGGYGGIPGVGPGITSFLGNLNATLAPATSGLHEFVANVKQAADQRLAAQLAGETPETLPETGEAETPDEPSATEVPDESGETTPGPAAFNFLIENIAEIDDQFGDGENGIRQETLEDAVAAGYFDDAPEGTQELVDDILDHFDEVSTLASEDTGLEADDLRRYQAEQLETGDSDDGAAIVTV